jgi:hypothetical protein
MREVEAQRCISLRVFFFCFFACLFAAYSQHVFIVEKMEFAQLPLFYIPSQSP